MSIWFITAIAFVTVGLTMFGIGIVKCDSRVEYLPSKNNISIYYTLRNIETGEMKEEKQSVIENQQVTVFNTYDKKFEFVNVRVGFFSN